MRSKDSASHAGKSFTIRTESGRDDSTSGTKSATKPKANETGLSRTISGSEGKGYPEKSNKF